MIFQWRSLRSIPVFLRESQLYGFPVAEPTVDISIPKGITALWFSSGGGESIPVFLRESQLYGFPVAEPTVDTSIPKGITAL